uniref:Putative phosphatase/phosphohexomutase n=1 Tax=uncultured marine group II/III euryarchaeote KM3_195_B08 TaxID=1457970 RepID=A0A075GUY5_9EURY|nr:putative phosphatase/phosphohexomutase [uncultured marine group II/III euryarchaeote KM3_195_B08]
MIKGILFDFDGVIVDSEPVHHISFEETLREFGITVSKERWFREFAGTGSTNIMETLFEENNIQEDVDKWVMKRRVNFWASIREKEVPIKKGLLEFLDLLEEKGIRKIIASGSTEQTIKIILKKIGIVDRFEAICGVESVKNKKPDPEVFLLGVEKLDLEKKECLIIEDSLNGVIAAKRAQIQYVCMESPSNQGLKDCSITIRDYREFPVKLLEDRE